MIIKDLVSELKKCTGRFPVVLLKGNETLGLSQDFQSDSDWAQFTLYAETPDTLDTEFLKHILDYCANEEPHSLFSDETPFEEFNVIASKQESESVFLEANILKCGIENVNNKYVFALYVEDMFEEETEEAAEEEAVNN